MLQKYLKTITIACSLAGFIVLMACQKQKDCCTAPIITPIPAPIYSFERSPTWQDEFDAVGASDSKNGD